MSEQKPPFSGTITGNTICEIYGNRLILSAEQYERERDEMRAAVEAGYVPLSEYVDRYGETPGEGVFVRFPEPFKDDPVVCSLSGRGLVWLAIAAGYLLVGALVAWAI